jgi:hypothetical protein
MSKRVRLTAQTYYQATMIVPLAIALLMLVGLTAGLVSGEAFEPGPDAWPVAWFPVLYLGLVAGAVLSWRAMTMAVYSTRTTLTIRSIWRTREVAWSDVAAVRSVADEGYGLPRRRTVRVRLHTGADVRLPVYRRARRLDEAVLRISHTRPCLLLSPEDYEDLLVDLRRYRRRAARAAAREADRPDVGMEESRP